MAKLHFDKWLPGLVFIAGLIATNILQDMSLYTARQAQQDNFAYLSREITLSIEQRLSTYMYVLRSVEGLYVSSQHISRDAFHNYVKNLRLATYYPGIQAIGFAPIVPQAEKALHTLSIRESGYLNYGIFPEGEREFYAPIVYIEPFAGTNRHIVGYDMFSEPIRRAALQRSRDSGNPVMSGKVTLVRDIGPSAPPSFQIGRANV